MRKMLVIAAVICIGVFFSVQSAKAVDLSMLPQKLQDVITNLLDTRFPPELQSVKLDLGGQIKLALVPVAPQDIVQALRESGDELIQSRLGWER